jgi:MFS family permease
MNPINNQHSQISTAFSKTTVPYWFLWAACFLGYTAIGMTIQVIPVYARQHMGANAVAAGLAVTVGSFASMVTRPIAGRLTDQNGGRPVVMTGAILGSMGGLAHLVAMNIPMLIMARLILGAGEGALFTASIGWVLSDASPAHRGKIAGHFGLSMWTGLASGPIIGAGLLAASGYRAVWLAACLLPVIAWIFLLCSPRHALPLRSHEEGPRALLPRAAWAPGTSMALASIGYGVIAAFLVPRFLFLRLPGQQFALATFGIAFMFTRFFCSPIVDRLGASTMLILTLIVEAVGLFGLFITDKVWLVFCCTVLTGGGISLLYPCMASLVTDTALPQERAAAIGLMTSAWDLGLAIGGPLGGVVAGTTNASPFAIGVAAALIALLPLIAHMRQVFAPKKRS